jgi:hypothetical protein
VPSTGLDDFVRAVNETAAAGKSTTATT